MVRRSRGCGSGRGFKSRRPDRKWVEFQRFRPFVFSGAWPSGTHRVHCFFWFPSFLRVDGVVFDPSVEVGLAVSDESADRDVGQFAAFGSPSRERGDGDAGPGRRPVGVNSRSWPLTSLFIPHTNHLCGMPPAASSHSHTFPACHAPPGLPWMREP